MGYFSDQHSLDYDREKDGRDKAPKKEMTKDQLINLIWQMDRTINRYELDKRSVEKLQLIKKKLDAIQMKKFDATHNKQKSRIWEPDHDDEDYEEENGFGRK